MSQVHEQDLPVRDDATRGGTRRFWRSVAQLENDAEFRRFLEAEFPEPVATVFDSVGRRQFLQLMGASLALAGISGCTRQPEEKIVPYVRAPENIVPGEPLYYATAMPLGNDSVGLLVESHMGRPTKIEGNPDHPSSLGATDVFAQAEVLTLYDPERSQVVRSAGEIRPWAAFLANAREVLLAQQNSGGAGLRLLTGTVKSPTLAAQIRGLLARFPQARWYQWEPLNADGALAGSRAAFGQDVLPLYSLDKAKVIVALDADFLATAPQHLRLARHFAARRREAKADNFNRLYVAEPTPTITGAVADHRLATSSTAVGRLAQALAQRLIGAPAPATALTPEEAAWADAVADDLRAQRGASAVIVGEGQPPSVHALAAAINSKLGNIGRTVSYARGAAEEPSLQIEGLRQLVADMNAGKVQALFMFGTNPSATAPAALDFPAALQKVGYRVHLGLYADETAELCHWHLPEAHFLESWGDTRAADGTVSIVQPLILPLYEGKSAIEVLSGLQEGVLGSGHDLVREHWRAERVADGATFDREWRRWLHDGIVADSAPPPVTVELTGALPRVESAPAPGNDTFELVLRSDPTIYDGRYANNGWLQELPKPITKLTWDNALLLSPTDVERLGLRNGDMVEVDNGGRKVTAPIWTTPGQAHGVATLNLGYGRSRGGEIAAGRGVDAYRLRTTAAAWAAAGIRLKPTGEHYQLVSTQDHGSMEGRDLVRTRAIDEAPKKHGHGEGHDERHESMYPEYKYEGNQWGMAIDLSACIGCNACTIACQAENNIPVVGKHEVSVGREMHWIRIDRYFDGSTEDPDIFFQPLPCMQCENAPCEPVCPANATMHSNEGLNDMVYNRCVGTRYCANNCPYKVRRFNFRLYSDWNHETVKMQKNPDVTVRSRGVMEKCTYCVQRINAVRIQAKKEERPIADGEIVTACQQTCPTDAIVFGNINDPNSRVAQLKRDPRNYGLLTDLNTRPRTSYLANLRNPNRRIEPAHEQEHHAGDDREESVG